MDVNEGAIINVITSASNNIKINKWERNAFKPKYFIDFIKAANSKSLLVFNTSSIIIILKKGI
jgi:hypothetical protein